MTPQLLTVIKEEVLRGWTEADWKQWIIEPKYDGARLIYHKGQFLSRTGKPLHNLDHIAKELVRFKGYTLDGEVYGENWAETMSVARSSKTVKVNNGLKFAVFEMMPDACWEEQISLGDDVVARRSWICDTILPWDINFNFVHAVRFQTANSYEDFTKIHAAHLNMGCDGTVLKKINSLYEFKRTKTWLKVKPIETYDCEVIGVVTGFGKHTGRMGALMIQPEGSEVVSKVGTGFSDEERDWQLCLNLIGRTIEVQARGLHPSGCLIEPRFIRVRGDK
jgi:DNA ligase-1